MEMQFKTTYVNEDLNYGVGVIEPSGDFAMRVLDPTHIIMTDHETWTPGTTPSAVFGITEEEYNWKDTDLEKLNDLAQRLRTDIPRDRLLSEQNGVRRSDRAETIDYGKYARMIKERNERRRDEVLHNLLTSENISLMYCGETGKPYVFNYTTILMYEDTNMAMTAANEYRKRGLPLLVSTFEHDKFNKADTRSIFQELMIMGYPVMMYVDKEKRQSMIPLKEVIKHKDFLGQKNNLIYSNPQLDLAIGNLMQFVRTPNFFDRTDEEKYKATVMQHLSFVESRVVEGLAEARYLVPTMTGKDGKVGTPFVTMAPPKTNEAPKEDGEGSAPAMETEAPETAKKGKKGDKAEKTDAPKPKRYLPVFTNGMEFHSEQKQDFKIMLLPYSAIMEIVKEAKLDGFVVNMRSRCVLPCEEARFKQIEDYLAWKAAREEEAKPSDAPVTEAPAEDTPFVPIVNTDANKGE